MLGRSGPLAAGEARGEMDWKKARALRERDTIAFVAPAGPSDPNRVEQSRKSLEAMGYRVRVPKDLFRRDRYLAGSDDARAKELNEAIRDPEVRAVFPCRGGYGLMRILDRVDYEAIRKDPKIITGYSDLTALHLAVARRSRVITFHSPMPESALYRVDGEYAYASSVFWKTVRGEGFSGNARDGVVVDLPEGRPKPVSLVGGKARGRVVGGNLTLICATLGTPYALEADGNILIVEDTGEAAYRIDRYFAQLRLAGVLDRIAGLIVGTFDDTDEKAVEVVVREYASQLRVPVLLNFPLGHTPFNATLPHGGWIELDADSSRVRLLETPVALD
ncbi:S66 peptidase family protein [Singulisphaera rosea]